MQGPSQGPTSCGEGEMEGGNSSLPVTGQASCLSSKTPELELKQPEKRGGGTPRSPLPITEELPLPPLTWASL